MIVRIATEGQFELPQEAYERVNAIDNEAVEAVEAGDESRFRELVDQMYALVRSEGRELGDAELSHSDVVLPPSDMTLEEAKEEFTGEGLIPESMMPGSS